MALSKRKPTYDMYGDTIKEEYNKEVTPQAPITQVPPRYNYEETKPVYKNLDLVQPTEKDVYKDLVDIANGNYQGATGASSLYNEAQGAEQRYNSIYDYITKNAEDLSQGELGVANTYLQNALADKRSANSAYNQYLASVGQAQDAKAQQQAAEANAMKYVGQSLAAQGLGTQGIAESTRAGLANAYARNVADIANQQANREASLYEQYLAGADERELQNAQSILQSKQYDIAKEEEEKAKEEIKQQEQLDKDISIFNSRIEGATTFDDKVNVYNEYLGKDFPEETKNELKNSYKATIMRNYGIENFENLRKLDIPTLKNIKDKFPEVLSQSELSLIDNEINNKIVNSVNKLGAFYSKDSKDKLINLAKTGALKQGDIVQITTNDGVRTFYRVSDKNGSLVRLAGYTKPTHIIK